jgi:hypothetical protein
MRILVDRFIYQGLRCAPRRHTVPDQDLCRDPKDQDEKRSISPAADSCPAARAGQGRRLFPGADVGAPAGNGEDEALGAENLDGAQDGVAANVVFLLELLDRGQWTGAPFTRRDLVAEDGRELPVSRLGQVMIHFHKIKVGQYRPGLISRYACSALL